MTQRGVVIPLRRPVTSDSAISEHGLVAACAAGDRAARAMLFERHVDAIHRFVCRMTGDGDVADDLVQATFLTAYRAAANFRGGSSVRTWLCGIAANVVRTQVRGEMRRRAAMSSVAEHTRDAVRIEAVEHRQLLGRLPAAIAALPHDLRAAFVMVDLEGARGGEAAAALGIPEGTLWRRLHDARGRLRAALLGGGS
jgi:RNA polymerase sigma-70 factor (ECF subfamily)